MSPTEVEARFDRAVLSSAVDHQPRGVAASAVWRAALETKIATHACNGAGIQIKASGPQNWALEIYCSSIVIR
jgi:hypothetical protein